MPRAHFRISLVISPTLGKSLVEDGPGMLLDQRPSWLLPLAALALVAKTGFCVTSWP